MLELLLLEHVVEQMQDIIRDGDVPEFQGNSYDVDKILDRCIELKLEFLQPYVIDSASKED